MQGTNRRYGAKRYTAPGFAGRVSADTGGNGHASGCREPGGGRCARLADGAGITGALLGQAGHTGRTLEHVMEPGLGGIADGPGTGTW